MGWVVFSTEASHSDIVNTTRPFSPSRHAHFYRSTIREPLGNPIRFFLVFVVAAAGTAVSLFLERKRKRSIPGSCP